MGGEGVVVVATPAPPPTWLAQIRQNASVSINKLKKFGGGGVPPHPPQPPFLQTWIRV